MIRVFAVLALVAAVAIAANTPGPVLKADRNRGERQWIRDGNRRGRAKFFPSDRRPT